MERNFSSDYLLTFTALSGSFSSLLLSAPTVSTPHPTDAAEDTACPRGFGGSGSRVWGGEPLLPDIPAVLQGPVTITCKIILKPAP